MPSTLHTPLPRLPEDFPSERSNGLKKRLWLAPGMLSLIAFAWFLALLEANAAVCAYVAYVGIYIAAALGWL